MYEIQTNAKGTRQMSVSDAQLETIKKYALFEHLVDSNGIIDEMVLEKLRLNARSLIEACPEERKDLVDLCQNVLFHDNMKAFGLSRLVQLYATWTAQHADQEPANAATE